MIVTQEIETHQREQTHTPCVSSCGDGGGPSWALHRLCWPWSPWLGEQRHTHTHTLIQTLIHTHTHTHTHQKHFKNFAALLFLQPSFISDCLPNSKKKEKKKQTIKNTHSLRLPTSWMGHALSLSVWLTAHSATSTPPTHYLVLSVLPPPSFPSPPV